MQAQDYIAAAQSVAITIAFLYLTHQTPALLTSWMAWRERQTIREDVERDKARAFESEQRTLERESRHEVANRFQKALMEVVFSHVQADKELAQALYSVKSAMENVCRHRPEGKP